MQNSLARISLLLTNTKVSVTNEPKVAYRNRLAILIANLFTHLSCSIAEHFNFGPRAPPPLPTENSGWMGALLLPPGLGSNRSRDAVG